jgi:hypothetical protein
VKKLALFVFAALATASLASAQATRTWVSGVGDDANPCSRTAPCKTFAGAISKTAAGGEINVLDPGGFGGVTITKSISIIAEDVEAGVLVSGTNAIIINAGVNDIILLDGLDIEGLGTGLNGIRFLAGAELHIRNSSIRNFRAASAGNGHGINFEPSGTSRLFLDNVDVTNNGLGNNGGGILFKPGLTGTASAVINNTRLNRNVFGIKVEATSANTVKVVMTDTLSTQNFFSGITVNGAVGGTQIFGDRVTSVNNGTTGVQSNGANGIIRLSNSTVYNNGTGLQVSASGQIISNGGNHVRGNGTDGTFTGTEAAQ